MSKYTWKNIVAFVVWECKICHKVPENESIEDHLQHKHGLKFIEVMSDTIYSPNFKYPNIIKEI